MALVLFLQSAFERTENCLKW